MTGRLCEMPGVRPRPDPGPAPARPSSELDPPAAATAVAMRTAWTLDDYPGAVAAACATAEAPRRSTLSATIAKEIRAVSWLGATRRLTGDLAGTCEAQQRAPDL
jgi:hypothetical protein